MARTIYTTLLALCLVLTGIASAVAETRMAAIGVFCGPGSPMILLDDQGLPILDADGDAIAAPDCPACHITFAVPAPVAQTVSAPFEILGVQPPARLPSLSTAAIAAPRARAPPVLA